MASQSVPWKLWEHPNPELTNMGWFRWALERETNKSFQVFLAIDHFDFIWLIFCQSFHDLYDFLVKCQGSFWDFCWKYFNPIHEGTYTRVVDKTAQMDSIPHWFEGIWLNFAENLLFSCSSSGIAGKEDDKIATVKVCERAADQAVYMTWGELRKRTGQLIQAMKAQGVVKGDCVAVCASNSVDTLLVFLATTAIGAIFSSSSMDMGVKEILNQLLQIKPQWLFMDDYAVYNGKKIDLCPKMVDIMKGMQSVGKFQGLVSQPRFNWKSADISHVPRAQSLADFLDQAPHAQLEFEWVAFHDLSQRWTYQKTYQHPGSDSITWW